MSRLFAGIGLLAVLLWTNSACATKQDEDGPQVDDTLVVGLRYPVGPLDPATTLGIEQTLILAPVYENLVRADYDDETGFVRYVPGLAKSWFVSEGGTRWTFQLETGHRFDDGSPVTAEAVKFSLDRALALRRGPSSALREFLKSVEVVDNHTVRLVLTESSHLVLPTLADRVGYIINPLIMENQVNNDFGSGWLAENTAGSGPYQLVRHRPRDHHVLAGNPYYHDEPGSIRRVIYKEIRDPSIRGLQLEKGEIDIALFLLVESLPSFAENPAFTVHSRPSAVFKNLALNTETGVFSDINARKAVAHAIDYDAFVEVLLNGQARRLRGPLPPESLGADPDSYSFDFDPGKARALLSKANVDISKPVELVYAGLSSGSDTTATFLKASLEAIGLKVRLQRLSVPALIGRVDSGNYDMVYMGWVALHTDPSAILNFWFDSGRIGSAGNYSRYNNEYVDELLHRSLAELDVNKRRQLIREIVARVNKDVPYVYLSQDNVWTVSRSDLLGYKLNPFNLGDLNLLHLRFKTGSGSTDELAFTPIQED